MKDRHTKTLEYLNEMLQSSKNAYEISVVIGKRARQIQETQQQAFYAELDSIGITNAEDHPTLGTETWRESVYNKYEKTPKPLLKAIEDLHQEKITYHYLDNDNHPNSLLQ